MINHLKSIEKHHHALFLAGVIAFVVLAVTAAATFVLPYKSLAKPPLPKGQIAPKCTLHTMGACLPHAKHVTQGGKLLPGAADPIYGLDLSNNDPIYGLGNWRTIRAAGNEFAYFKVTEGTGFVDRTAAPMASSAKAAGLTVGGYDFLHVCQDSATGEANLFSAYLKADGLLGANTLPPVADVEYGAATCNARAWLDAWRAQVQHDTGRVTAIYTGAWYWQPHLGAYWPSNALAWISGYNVRYPFMPSGRRELDIWQDSDKGWNGVTHVDHNIWEQSQALFNSVTGGKTKVVKKHHLVCFGKKAQKHNKVCVTARTEVAKWQRASKSTSHVLGGVEATVKTLTHRKKWFDNQITKVEKQYS